MPCISVRDGYVTIKTLPTVAFDMSGAFTLIEYRADKVYLFLFYHNVCSYMNLFRSAASAGD